MKYFTIIVLLTLAVPAFSLKPIPPLDIFKPLDDQISGHGWAFNSFDEAKIFEKIYFENRSNKSFEQLLLRYLDNDDKFYWTGIFLDEPYYTKINNYDLSMKVLKAGLEFNKNDEEKIRYLWVIGKKLYYKNQKAEALKYLVPAYTLSEKYPANTPAWDSEQEADMFEAFIRSNMK
jgi:hypothetical protein